MKNITDLIEHYLKQILVQSADGLIEIQRSQLADEFNCVPSQINYVISTRFTLEKGYHVESKRGGGGFIRIRKITAKNERDLYFDLLQLLGDKISQTAGEDIIDRLYEDEIITQRERAIMKGVISRQVIQYNLPIRDQIRARLLKSMITSILFVKEGEE